MCRWCLPRPKQINEETIPQLKNSLLKELRFDNTKQHKTTFLKKKVFWFPSMCIALQVEYLENDSRQELKRKKTLLSEGHSWNFPISYWVWLNDMDGFSCRKPRLRSVLYVNNSTSYFFKYPVACVLKNMLSPSEREALY